MSQTNPPLLWGLTSGYWTGTCRQCWTVHGLRFLLLKECGFWLWAGISTTGAWHLWYQTEVWAWKKDSRTWDSADGGLGKQRMQRPPPTDGFWLEPILFLSYVLCPLLLPSWTATPFSPRTRPALPSSSELQVKLVYADNLGKLPTIRGIITGNTQFKFQITGLENKFHKTAHGWIWECGCMSMYIFTTLIYAQPSNSILKLLVCNILYSCAYNLKIICLDAFNWISLKICIILTWLMDRAQNYSWRTCLVGFTEPIFFWVF